ncbi:stage V sporulation protein AD [Alicyclobacillus sp. SP_1]|uniref:stage V sporulation protein AD n=1 Tax=Alicyclobacillus sp. SP_1 TaxID=2942475 RepID=UPI00215738EE|nr:stage V sporulation protein AD [Alicyclobacillus sp. SP_1]
MLIGHQSWKFSTRPQILSTAVVGGPFEAQGPLAEDFDILHGDLLLQQKSWEQAEQMLLHEACDKAIEKAHLTKDRIQFFLSGDLMNQIISSSFAARTLASPYLGIFGACSTSMEGLALAALLVDKQCARYVMTATASHNASAEKQYRYPTEYGSQKPPTAQWTVTAGGAAVVGAVEAAANEAVDGSVIDPIAKDEETKGRLAVTSATVGRVVDMGLTDPFNMGAAMAPAALATIEAHFRDLDVGEEHYDLVVTGDLGKVGAKILGELMVRHGIHIPDDRYADCGLLIYGDNPAVWSGGSGCGCSASVTYGHLFRELRRGRWKRILVVATGALLSPLSFQQGESIPCIAHAVAIERDGDTP